MLWWEHSNPRKEEEEVDYNNECDDLEPSLYLREKEKEEWKLGCLESPRVTIKFVEAPIEELPGYILEFEEEPILKFYIYAQTIVEKCGRVDAHIDPHKLTGKLFLKLIEIWEWDTFPWDPGVWRLEEKNWSFGLNKDWCVEPTTLKKCASWEATHVWFR